MKWLGSSAKEKRKQKQSFLQDSKEWDNQILQIEEMREVGEVMMLRKHHLHHHQIKHHLAL